MIKETDMFFGKRKFDCAIEITKNNPYEYAKYSYEKFLKDFERWGIEPSEIIK